MESVLSWDWYRDPRVLEVDERRLFRSSWQYVGPLESLRRRGGPRARLGDLAGARPGQRGDLPRRLQHMPVRACELKLDAGPAVAVGEQCLRAGRPGRVLVAPLHQRDEHRVQVQALLGPPVLLADR